jgi:hypothetical protein
MLKAQGGGYYTVLIETNAQRKIPYVVFARSDYQAARIVRDETGHMAQQRDIEGPYHAS